MEHEFNNTMHDIMLGDNHSVMPNSIRERHRRPESIRQPDADGEELWNHTPMKVPWKVIPSTFLMVNADLRCPSMH